MADFDAPSYLHPMITAYKAGRVFSGDGSMYHKGIVVLDSEGRIVYSGPDADGLPEAEDFG
ncbi:MAG: hypothetical protein IH599_02445, partial [Bacteroidales bacterium]|nr:hypothetical protein [Bacteroidales bacterium]